MNPFHDSKPFSDPATAKNLEQKASAKNQDNAAVQGQRALGALMLLIGLGLTYFQIWQPLQSARAHSASSMSVSMKLAALAPVALLFGALFLAFPRWSLVHLGRNQRTPQTPLGWAVMLVAVALGFSVWFWMEAQFKSLGYTTSF